MTEEDEDRIDVEEAQKTLAEMEASGETPIPLADIKAEFGLCPSSRGGAG